VPRLTDATREARREEIADSVIRVMARVGFSRLSMAEVFAESGLSAGSVYSHFASKEDLAVFVMRRAQAALVDDLLRLDRTASEADEAMDPAALTRWLIDQVRTTWAIFPALMQFYAESAVESTLRTTVRESIGGVRVALTTALEPWAARTAAGNEVTGTEALDLAPVVDGILIVCGGYVSRSVLGGDTDVDGYLDALRHTVGANDAAPRS
jgi:AcrR family transcriptional regulator